MEGKGQLVGQEKGQRNRQEKGHEEEQEKGPQILSGVCLAFL